MKIRQTITTIMCIGLILANINTIKAEDTERTFFTDVNTDYIFYNEIKDLFDNEIVSGFSDNTFRANLPVTRGALAKFIVRGFDIPEDTTCDKFKDVKEDSQFFKEITTLKCKGVIGGYSDGTFRSAENVTRSQAAKFIVEGARTVSNSAFPMSRMIPLFIDLKIENKFFEQIDAIASVQLNDDSRIASGYSNGNFGINDSITRGQMAKMISKTRSYITDGGSYNPPLSKFDFTKATNIIKTELDTSKYNNSLILASYTIDHSTSPASLTNVENIPAKDFESDKLLWENIVKIIPDTVVDDIHRFEVFYGDIPYYAFTQRVMDENGNTDMFELKVNRKFMQDNQVISNYIIHESSHMITLGNAQANVDDEIFNTITYTEKLAKTLLAYDACETVYIGYGCMKEDSTIMQFADRFWTEELAMDNMPDDYIQKNNNKYVSIYSMTAVYEDIAETFTFFVKYDKPTDNNSIINQKINFLYEFPEYVELRDEFRAKIGME